KIGWDPTRPSKSTARSARAGAAGASASAPAAPNTGGSVATPDRRALANGGPHARVLPSPSSSSATPRVASDPAAKPRVGWNSSRVGNQAVPAPLAVSDNTAGPPTAPEAATSGTAVDKPTPRVGWNPSRIGNPAIPAPVMNCRASGAKEAEAASAVATAVTAAVAVAGRGATKRGGAGEGAATVGNGDGGGGVRRAEVPLHLRAVLLYASTQRGIDLRKWFDLGGGGDGEMEVEGQAGETAAALLTRVQFELVLAGLAEGLKAGLSEEERHEIDTAIAPQVIEAAVAAALATSGRSGACSSSSSSNSEGNNGCSVIDVGRLLDLCGIPPTTSLPPEAACPETPPPRHSDPQESVGQDVVADIVEKAGPGAPGGSVYDNRGGEAAAKARVVAEVEADETALRRVARQADLFDRVLASLGLKQPVVGSSQGSTLADWEASLRVSTVHLEAFRKGLAEVGLHLSRTRAIALATRACGPLRRFSGSGIGDDGTGRPRAGRRPNNNAGEGSARSGNSLSSGSSGSRMGTKNGQPRSVDRLSRRGGGRASLQRNSPQRQQQQRQQRDNGGNRRRRRPQEARGRTAARGDGGGGKRAPSLSSRRNGQAHPVLSPTTRWRSTPPAAPSRTQSSSPPQRNSSHGEPEIPSWDLRRYLRRLRCESKSRQARCDQRRRRLRCNPTGQEEGCEDSEGSAEEREGGGGGGGGGGATGERGVVEGDEDDAAALSVFAAWGKRIRWERAERERERKREFQSALAGRPHSLTLEQLLECVCRFEIMPPEVMSRELRAMGKACSESVEGTRMAREIVRRWSQASPASRNACGTDGPEQKVWEDVQTLSGAQRRARACAIVAKQREEELAESEDTSASVSRGLFLAYVRNSYGGTAGGRGRVSLQRWLEDRQAAMQKARELEAGRERAQALSKADTAGRKARQFALVSELKEEMMRLVGSTKKTQKVDKAPGMEASEPTAETKNVLRSSREGLDIHRRLKRLESLAAEEHRARKLDTGGSGGRQKGGRQKPATSSSPSPPSLLLSKRAFNAEMGDVLFSLTADGSAAARARELAGVPLMAADLRKKWAKEGRGGGAEADGVDASHAEMSSPPAGKEIGVPFAVELFGLEEALLLGRGQKDAEEKRERALQQYRIWSKQKSKEARKARRVEQAKQAEEADRKRRRKAEGLKAYRRWLRLASKEAYFSPQNNKVVPRVRSSGALSSRSCTRRTLSCSGSGSNPVTTATTTTPLATKNSSSSGAVVTNGDGSTAGGVSGGGGAVEEGRRRRHWNPSTEGAGDVYMAAAAGFPDFL
ncbi:unnamed protein product, partial [Ectocarpus sp. 8 AP-2014]